MTRQGVALCLSGGGYRAALFHLGALRRLNELGLLSRVDTISAVSGGSILAALLADELRPWPSPGTVTEDFERVGQRMRALARKNIRTLWFFKRLLVPLLWCDSTTAVRTLQRRYAKTFRDVPLTALPDRQKGERPRFIFCATDMSFGINWVAEQERVGDYQAGYASPPPAEWTLSRAVAASSCFPPVFDPLPAGLTPDQLKDGMARGHSQREELINRLRLSDGGVYDNLGLEPVWKSHALLLVSDGGATFDFRPDRGFPRRLGRYLTVQGNQAGAVRKRWLIANFIAEELAGTYWGVGSSRASYQRPGGYPKDLIDEVISEVRTDLDYFSPCEQGVIENHGYQVADAAVDRHLDYVPTTEAPATVPNPEYLDPDRVRRELRLSNERRLLGRWGWPPWD